MGSTVIDPSSASPEFRAYERVRGAVVRMKAEQERRGASAPSAYWAEELGTIDYMIEASPLIIRKLRHHSFHITGIRPFDYRARGDDAPRELFAARLAALRELGGDDLLVPESPALGGFGYEIGGRLFNVDTLKFYEALIAMERGGILSEVRAREYPVVCEIGAGWGGFAHQFKTLFPRSTYIIVDFPELFLFSATYLATLFPQSRIVFAENADFSLHEVGDVDFVFVPDTFVSRDCLVTTDVLVNMVSFQEMTDAQVRGYAAGAADAGCRLVYSLNRERSSYNTELVSVSEALGERYRLTEIPVLNTDYTTARKKPPKAEKPKTRSESNYRHLVGRLAGSEQVAVPVGRAEGGAAGSTGSIEPRVLLGMTLYNNASHLPEALDSLLAQTFPDFLLVLLDDASADGTQVVAREYAQRDPRIKYVRHDIRKAMVATWREVVEIATCDCPSAGYFAWVSDHDRWHPRWLERLVAELDGDDRAVLAYPITRRIGPNGIELDKGPRLFDTNECRDLNSRWKHMCHAAVGAGDMVYGLMRVKTLIDAGIFRRVLRPDRLLVAELILRGGIRQVPEALWFRRNSNGASVARQRHSLVLAGDEPRWFHAPPWFQHSLLLWREYARKEPAPLAISRTAWTGMLLRYQLTYGWKHFRKTEASHALGRGIDQVIWAKKITKHYWHHAVYNTLVGVRTAWGRTRRFGRRALYEALVLTHRLGLRGRGKAETR
ncbi:MAG TPA: putative sugar O-methyltransferase [Vicinamibacterales bacterium]|jgi:glycosyltransferase involved in cell wall biosynthesis